MTNKKTTYSSSSSDEFLMYIFYIIFSPTFLGLLISKWISFGFNKTQINKKLKTKIKVNYFSIFLSIFLLLTIFISLIISIYYILVAKANNWKWWWYLIFAILINIYAIAIIFTSWTIFITNIEIKKFEEKLQTKDYVKILEKAPEPEGKDSNFKKQYLFFINYQATQNNVSKILSNIKDEKFSDENLGVIINRSRGIFVPETILNRGTCVFGVTGGGKTNTLELFIEYGIFKRQNIIFVNGKGDYGLYEDLKVACENNNYNFKCWSPKFNIPKQNKFIYNPFKDKDANSVTSMLMEIGRYSLLEATTPGAIYYKDNEMACINLICKLLLFKQKNHSANDKTDYSICLENLFRFADLEKMSEILNVNEILQKDKKERLESKFNFYVNLQKKLNTAINNNTLTSEKLNEFRSQAWNIIDGNNLKQMPNNWCKDQESLLVQIDKMFKVIKSERAKLKSLNEDDQVQMITNEQLREIYQDYLDVANDDDKARALRQIKTTFRNLRNLNPVGNKIVAENGESLKEIIQSPTPTILLVSLDTASLKTQSSQIARMLISDLKQNMSSVREINPNSNLMCIFDEFGSFATQDIAELQEQGRSYGLQTVYALQTVSNLTQVGEDFAARLLGNCNTYIIHRMREDRGAEQISNIIGTNPAFEWTERQSEGETTGERSVREVQQYIFHPREIRQLHDHFILMTTVVNGIITPIAGSIKVDYSDIRNYKAQNLHDSTLTSSQRPTRMRNKDLEFVPRKIN